MTDSKDLLLTIVMAVFAAGYFALMTAFLAHDCLGFSQEAIRHAAIISATLLAMALAIDFLSRKLRRAR